MVKNKTKTATVYLICLQYTYLQNVTVVPNHLLSNQPQLC